MLAGGYVLREADRLPDVALVGMGAILPDVLGRGGGALGRGSRHRGGLPDLGRPRLPRSPGAAGLGEGDYAILDVLFPAQRRAPIVAVLDGHPHTLAFLSAVRCVPIANLGVHDFGQSGDVQDLYKHFGIDTETIIGAALDLIDGAS